MNKKKIFLTGGAFILAVVSALAFTATKKRAVVQSLYYVKAGSCTLINGNSIFTTAGSGSTITFNTSGGSSTTVYSTRTGTTCSNPVSVRLIP